MGMLFFKIGGEGTGMGMPFLKIGGIGKGMGMPFFKNQRNGKGMRHSHILLKSIDFVPEKT